MTGERKMSEVYYLSNYGKGPMIARLISVKDGVVTMERKPSLLGRSRWIRFTLSEKFLHSRSCGWRKTRKRPLEIDRPRS